MSSSGNAEGDASNESTPKVVKFIVKMPAQQGKKELELPLSTTVLDTKKKIAEIGDIPTDRQRLIYSGRVMKNEETLEFYKVTEGTTIHMVKAANPPAAKPSSSGAGGSARPAVPANLSSGSGNTPLAGLTGARFAGHVNLPNADIFGPDGGMGPPPGPEEMANIMGRPETQAAMNELLNNPQLMDSLINSNPMFSNMGAQARQMLRDPNFRQLIMNPEMLRQVGALSGLRGGAGSSFPAPGATDTTPEGAQASQDGSNRAAANLFAGLAGGANPFEALLGGAAEPPMFLPGYEGAPGASDQFPTDEELLVQIRLARQMGLLPPGPSGGAGGAPAQPVDGRPLEERFAEQLRQMNDMGFSDVELNLQALVMTNGDVQAAIEFLFSN